MKLKLTILIVAMLICCNKCYSAETAQHEKIERDINAYVLVHNKDYSPVVHTFLTGDSSFQIAEREAAAERDRERLRLADQARQTRAVGNPYPYGWCTWYVAEKVGITAEYGDAKYWPVNSQEPKEGGIVVTYESWYGHVAYVEAVNGDNLVLSEMNYAGWGYVSRRVISKNNPLIKGFLI